VLEGVLDRLGPPTQWLPPGHPTSVAPLSVAVGHLKARARNLFHALWRGPEDWRLPYLSFSIFALGVIALPLLPLFLLVSYLLARAGVAAAHQKGLELDAPRKWLLYPQISLVCLTLLLTIVLGPPWAFTVASVKEMQSLDSRERRQNKVVTQKLPIGNGNFVEKQVTITWENPEVVTTLDRIFAQFPGGPRLRPIVATVFFVAGTVVVWMALLGFVAGNFPALVGLIFYPFLQRCEGRSTRRWSLVGLIGGVVWFGIGYRIAVEAGL
jgi:hypothetical protein